MSDANPEEGATPEGGTTVDGAQARISALFAQEQELPTPGEEVVTEDKVETAETPEGDTEAVEPKYKVKIGDEEREVTVDEMRKGYMMESDYRKKTTEIAERRKALEEKEAAIETQLSEAEALLELELESLSSAEMQELKDIDPETYIKEFDKAQAKVNKFNKLKEARQTEQAEKQKDIAKREYDALLMAIPEWIDPSVRNSEANEGFEYLKTLGYTDKELESLVDHRVFVMARNSMRLDRINNADLDSKKVNDPPKSVQPGTPGSRSDDKVKGLKSQLKKSGNIRDAQRLFKELME